MSKQDITTGFQTVDASDADFLIQFIADVAKVPSVIESFETQLKLMDLKPGHRVLDIGCGIGDRVADFAKIVGDDGYVVGTDLSNAMVIASKERHTASGLPLEFHVANALEQPFPDASFDRIRTERVLLYIKETPSVLREFHRLLKTGGILVVADVDFDAMVIAHADKTLTRKIIQYISDSFPSGTIGRELFGHFSDIGFCEIVVKPLSYFCSLEFTKRLCGGVIQSGVETGVFDEAEISNWWSTLENNDRDGKFLAVVEGFIVAGRK
jgi:SAM-dependent methyltransferase